MEEEDEDEDEDEEEEEDEDEDEDDDDNTTQHHHDGNGNDSGNDGALGPLNPSPLNSKTALYRGQQHFLHGPPEHWLAFGRLRRWLPDAFERAVSCHAMQII